MITFKEGETVYIGKKQYIIDDVTATEEIIIQADGEVSTIISTSEAQAFLRHAPYDIPAETTRPVFADAKVGDDVWSSQWGKGTIQSIDADNIYPIKVKYACFDGCFNTYLFDGRIADDIIHPNLFPSLTACKEYWASVEE